MSVRQFSGSALASLLLLAQVAPAAAPPSATVDQCDMASREQELKELFKELDEQTLKEIEQSCKPRNSSEHQRSADMKRKNVDHLMRKFTHLFKQAKYLEAKNIALKAHKRHPDNLIVAAALVLIAARIENGQEQWVITAINEPQPRRRQPPEKEMTKKQLLAWRLRAPCSVRFDRTPLESVIDEMRDLNAIKIVFDDPALVEAGVSRQSLITIEFERRSLKSGLTCILRQVHLTWRIKDNAVQITTKKQTARESAAAVDRNNP